MKVPFVDLSANYHSIQEDVDAAVHRVLNKCDYILGQAVKDLEDNFAAYCEAPYAVGLDSGYSALELILRAADIGPGDEVITVANTFMATALAIWRCGARPVLVDADPATYTLNPALLEAAITPATRAVIPVHLFGQPADMDPILEIARRHNLLVVEDACQAHGARYKGKRTGSLGDAAAFSFYPAKNLGAYGDGGMAVTRRADLAEKIAWLRNVGQSAKNLHTLKGFNHRLDTLQASILLVKLPHLDQWNAARRQSAALYNQLLAGAAVVTPQTAPQVEHVFHLYVVRVHHREALIQVLNEAGIGTGIHYPTPIHMQPAFQDLGYPVGSFPVSESYASQILSLPMYPEISPEAVAYVCDTIKAFVKNGPASST